jgi:DNA polymerase-3 subunit alpha
MKFKFTKEYANKYDINTDNDFELLKHLSYKKLNELNLPEEEYKIYKNRIEKELNFFKDTDMPSYILTWLDILNHTKGLFLLRYPSSSLVLFLLGISKIDPIKWDLIFELDFKKK